MYDISQSYYPMVLELRDTAVELNESLEVFNNRVVLNEIPDTFMKVYISGYVEIEESKLPKQGEYVVDYKTGIITMDGNTPDNTIVNVSYYGRGIIQYPADRIYSHNPSPEVAGSLQRILDRGEEAITELNLTADVSKRQSHANNSSFFANQDWTRLAKKLQGSGQVNYNSTTRGIEVNGELWLQINVRIPVDPESKYWVRAKVKKSVGDGNFYLGAMSLDNNYEEISTDGAKTYNYFGASNKTITSGSTEIIEGYISGYNTVSESDYKKFDPEAKYFDLVIIANYQGSADITKTVIEWLEVYRSPKSMHVQDNGSFGGDLEVKGFTSMKKDLNMNNSIIDRAKTINGEFGNIAKSTDEWLRINDGGGHTNGVFFGSSLVRTDGTFHIGSNGSVLNVTSSILNYRNLFSVDGTKALINTPLLSITGDVDIDKTLNVDGNTSLGGSLEVRYGQSFNVRDGQTTLRATTGATTLVVYQEASTGFLLKMGYGSDAERFTVAKDGAVASKSTIDVASHGSIGGTLTVDGTSNLKGALNVTGVSTLSSSLYGSGNAEFTGKVWAGKNTTYGSSPLVTLAIGDADTGINWMGDGVLELKANNALVVKFDNTKFDIERKLNAKASASITGSLTVSDDATISDTLTAGNTSLASLTVRAGGTVAINGNSTFNGTVDLSGNTVNNVDVMNFKNGGFTVDVSDINRGSGTQDTYNVFASSGQIKLWRPTFIVGNADVTGDVKVSNNLVFAKNSVGSEDVIFDGSTSAGLKVSNSSGYVTITPLNSSYAHIYTDRSKFIFNRAIESVVNKFGSYDSDLLLQRADSTKMTLGASLSTIHTNLLVDAGDNTEVTIQANDSGTAELKLIGDIQGTGRVFVGQSATTGGGIEYNGDSIPETSGAGTDYMALYRRASGTDSWTARNKYDSNDWEFRGRVKALGVDVTGTTTFTGQVTLNNDMIVADGKSIRPATPEGATLGTPEFPFQDVYIGANSLYVDGKKVVSSEADTIDISTDPDQHMSINTSGLGTTRLASAKEVVVYSGQLVTLQSGGNMTALSSGLVSLKSDVNGSGIELVSQSALGNVSITSGNRIEFSATGDISFLQRPKFNGSTVVTFADNISASKITQSSSLRFVTDSDKANWNGKVNRTGDTLTGFLTLHADPTQPLHAVTKQYVDAIKQSLDIKDSVRVATTGNITLSGGQTIDGVTVNTGNRVLVKNQTDAKQNGIWVVQSGAWVRAIDMDEDADVTSGAFVFVEEGIQFGNMGFVLVTDGAINIGVTPIGFTQFSGAGQVINGTGLYKNGNEIGLTNTVSAGTYKSVTVNEQGRVTNGWNPTTLAGYGITDALNVSGGTINGMLAVNNTDGVNGGLVIRRNNKETAEFVKMSVDDGSATFYYNNDEKDARFHWLIENTDTENSDGSGANTHSLLFSAGVSSGSHGVLTIDSKKVFHEGLMGSGSGLDADKLDGLQGSSYMRTDANTTTSGILTAKRLVGTENSYTINIPTGSTEAVLTHNFNTTQYRVVLGANTVNRHAGWKTKTANTVVIEIDDVHTTDVLVDVILMPI